jgi:hypothetical protein
LFAVNGADLAADSAPFLWMGSTEHRASPWFAVAPLRLNSVEQARIRYEAWCADEWDRQNAGPMGSWIDDQGKAHEFPRPVNPYRATKLAKK